MMFLKNCAAVLSRKLKVANNRVRPGHVCPDGVRLGQLSVRGVLTALRLPPCGFLLLMPLMLIGVCVQGQEKNGGPETVASLINVLESDASTFDKAKACQRLAIVADGSAVPALASLLNKTELSVYARTALERIPDPAADRALRDSLNTLDSKLLAGVIHSIGKRRDKQAVEQLAALLGNRDTVVAMAAAQSLGEIGNDAAVEQLKSQLDSGSMQLRTSIADALLRSAQLAMQDGDRQRATRLCDLVHKANVPRAMQLAAIYDSMLAQGVGQTKLLVEQLQSDDKDAFRLALQAARQLGNAVTGLLVDHMPGLPPDRQGLVLLTLADLHDRSSLPVFREAAGSTEESVSLAAIRGISKLKDGQSVDMLFNLAVRREGAVSEAARQALAEVNRDDFDSQVVEELEKQIVQSLDDREPRVIRAAMQLAADRHLAEATPKILRVSARGPQQLRQAALEAAAQTASIREFADLIDLAIKNTTPQQTDVARGALQTACTRLPQEEAAEILANAMRDAPPSTRRLILEQMPILGGQNALRTVVAACRDEQTVETATRVLGEWLTADAARPALELAPTLPENRYRLRLLRGCIRIARQLEMNSDERNNLIRDLLAVVQRDEERILVLEVLRRHRSAEGLIIATTLVEYPAIREECCQAILEIAAGLRGSRKEVETALDIVVRTSQLPATVQQANRMLEELKGRSAAVTP